MLYDRYVSASVALTVRVRVEAALDVSPTGSYASHHTAAALWGGVVPATSDVHVTVPGQQGRSTRRGVRAYCGRGKPPPTTSRGLPIATPTQTFLDCAAAGLDLVELVVLGDSLVKACRTTPTELTEAARGWRGAGAKRARRAVAYVREHVDSSQESRLRMLLVLAGLPEPRVNLILRHQDGSWRVRLDLAYEAERLIVEYDGRQHAENTTQWHRDLERREQLERDGWRLIVVTARDLERAPGAVLARVRDALVSRGARRVRRDFKPEWQRYFG